MLAYLARGVWKVENERRKVDEKMKKMWKDACIFSEGVWKVENERRKVDEKIKRWWKDACIFSEGSVTFRQCIHVRSKTLFLFLFMLLLKLTFKLFSFTSS